MRHGAKSTDPTTSPLSRSTIARSPYGGWWSKAMPGSAATWYSNTIRLSSLEPYDAAPNASSSRREYVSASAGTNARMRSRAVSSVRISELEALAQQRERFVVFRVDVVFLRAFVLAVVFLWDLAFEVRFAFDFDLSLGVTRSGSSLYPAPRF